MRSGAILETRCGPAMARSWARFVPGQPPRLVYMRRYFDSTLQQEMLLRVIIEEGSVGQVVEIALASSKAVYHL